MQSACRTGQTALLVAWEAVQEERTLWERHLALKALTTTEPEPEDMGKRLMELLGPLRRSDLEELILISKAEMIISEAKMNGSRQ